MASRRPRTRTHALRRVVWLGTDAGGPTEKEKRNETGANTRRAFLSFRSSLSLAGRHAPRKVLVLLQHHLPGARHPVCAQRLHGERRRRGAGGASRQHQRRARRGGGLPVTGAGGPSGVRRPPDAHTSMSCRQWGGRNGGEGGTRRPAPHADGRQRPLAAAASRRPPPSSCPRSFASVGPSATRTSR